MDAATFLTCLLAVSLLTITPGVDTILVIRNSIRGGWQDGITTSLGICSGLFIHAGISALGISIILLKTAWAFNGLKMIGACYLIYLGYVSIKQRTGISIITNDNSLKKSSVRRSLTEGFLSNILNPKTIIFYLAFLPQFISHGSVISTLAQSLIVAGTHFIVAMIYGFFLVFACEKARQHLSKRWIITTLNNISGSFLIFFGIGLLFEEV
ncbi:MAG: LysE family translocator [Desulfotalea sp.]